MTQSQSQRLLQPVATSLHLPCFQLQPALQATSWEGQAVWWETALFAQRLGTVASAQRGKEDKSGQSFQRFQKSRQHVVEAEAEEELKEPEEVAGELAEESEKFEVEAEDSPPVNLRRLPQLLPPRHRPPERPDCQKTSNSNTGRKNRP